MFFFSFYLLYMYLFLYDLLYVSYKSNAWFLVKNNTLIIVSCGKSSLHVHKLSYTFVDRLDILGDFEMNDQYNDKLTLKI